MDTIPKKVYIILLTLQKINGINTGRIDQHQTLPICETPYQIPSMQLSSEGKQLSDRSGDILDQLRRNAELLTTVISRIEMQDNEISSIKRKMNSLEKRSTNAKEDKNKKSHEIPRPVRVSFNVFSLLKFMYNITARN